MVIKRINRGRSHSYTIDGVKATGVTTALSEGLPKPQLTYWAARVVAETVADMPAQDLETLREMGRDAMVAALKAAPNQQRDNAAVRGTKVHNLAEQLVYGHEITVPDELLGHVESAARFMDAWKIKPILVERPVASYQWMYAGTFDIVAELPDGQRILFDYKTSASGIWPDTALQLAAYRWADFYLAEDGTTETPMAEVDITDCKAVWLRADGYDVIPLTTSKTVHTAFLHTLAVARFRKDMDAWKGEAEQPTKDAA